MWWPHHKNRRERKQQSSADGRIRRNKASTITCSRSVSALGGLTPAWLALGLCEAEGIGCEVLGWGNMLISVANLRLMLADDCCSYFGQSVPSENGMRDVIRTAADGQVTAPDDPGLGVPVHWDAMEAATVHRLVFD